MRHSPGERGSFRVQSPGFRWVSVSGRHAGEAVGQGTKQPQSLPLRAKPCAFPHSPPAGADSVTSPFLPWVARRPGWLPLPAASPLPPRHAGFQGHFPPQRCPWVWPAQETWPP